MSQLNVENPPKPQPFQPQPTGVYHVPAALPQPLIDPLTGALIKPQAPQPAPQQ